MNIRVSVSQHKVLANQKGKLPLKNLWAPAGIIPPVTFSNSICLVAIYPRGKIDHDHLCCLRL